MNMYLFTEEEYNNAKFRDLLSCKCDVCGKEIYKSKKDIDASKSGNVFCSRSCAATYNNSHREFKQEWKNKISNTLQSSYKERTGFSTRKEKKTADKVCKVCGQHTCVYPHICKSAFVYQKSKNLSKLGFDFSKIGTFEIYDEFFKVQYLLYKDYYEECLSFTDIQNVYSISSLTTIYLLFKFLNLSPRSASEAQRNYILSDKYVPSILNSKIFKCGWHISWDDRQHYYRSSYEEDYMKELDEERIEYYTEKLRIQYFDTEEEITRIAIPDFYIPSTNTIVEVKSEYTYDRQNMIDKVKSYRELGYNFKLLYEHIMYDDCI